MNKSIIFLVAACALAVLVGIYLLSPNPQNNQISESENPVDVTFVLSGELLDSGGLVKLVIRPDTSLEERHQDVEIHLSAKATIVYLDLGASETYKYRFTRQDNGNEGTTERFTVGSFRQEDGRKDATVYDHHVDFGPKWPMSSSREVSSLLNIHDQSKHVCTQNLNISICDATASIPDELLQ